MGFLIINKYREKEQPEYYDTNIFPRKNDEVFVDLGANTVGETGEVAVDVVRIDEDVKDKIEPGYTFYMRYHGRVVADEFSLMAKWDNNKGGNNNE